MIGRRVANVVKRFARRQLRVQEIKRRLSYLRELRDAFVVEQ